MKLAAMFVVSATIQAEKSKHLLVEVEEEDKPPSPPRHSIRGQNKAGVGGGRSYECDHECNGWPYQNCKVYFITKYMLKYILFLLTI